MINQNFEVLNSDCSDSYDCRVLGYDIVQFGRYPSVFGEAYCLHLHGGNVLQASRYYDLEDRNMKTMLTLVIKLITVIGLYECEN
jgi:hypothetical protein